MTFYTLKKKTEENEIFTNWHVTCMNMVLTST